MEDPGSQEILLEFILLIVLTLLNAFFSATEMSMVSLNRSRVEQKAEEGDKKYIRLLSVLEQPNHFLSTIQVGITLITILSGASLADSLGHVIAGWMGNTKTALATGSFLSLAFLTYISIVFGELYPKRIAMNLKDELAVRTAPIVILLGKIVSPFVWLLSASTNLLSRITPMEFDDPDEKMTRDEIEYMLTNSEATLDADEIEMLQGIFSLDEMVAREVMVPRTDAFMVDINDDTKEIIESILKQNFSRIPVYDDDKDNVIGLIHTKRLLNEGFINGFDNIVLRKILQEPLFVPETIFVDDLLKELRNTQNQMAILLDEYVFRPVDHHFRDGVILDDGVQQAKATDGAIHLLHDGDPLLDGAVPRSDTLLHDILDLLLQLAVADLAERQLLRHIPFYLGRKLLFLLIVHLLYRLTGSYQTVPWEPAAPEPAPWMRAHTVAHRRCSEAPCRSRPCRTCC